MENKLSVPVFMKRYRRKRRTRRRWYLVKKTLVKYLKSTPRLQIIFTNDEYNIETFLDECHCDLLPPTCYLLQLECNCPLKKLENINMLMSLVLPNESKLLIETYTFIMSNGLFCQELRFNCSPHIGRVKFLKTKIAPYFANNSPMQSCIIVFGSDLSIFYVLELIQVLHDWFPKSEIPVWGCLTDMLMVCHCCFNKDFCKVKSEMVLMFISSPDMKVWTLILDETCNTKKIVMNKLTTFKEEVELKLNSVALMHVSSRRLEYLFTFETRTFQKLFPSVILFPIYGEASFGGKNWLETFETIPKGFGIMAGANTTIMIITYN